MTTISKAKISGTVKAYPSKSEMQRVVLGALLSEGKTTILNPSFCDDGIQSLKVAKLLGAKVIESESEITIEGVTDFECWKGEIPCGESGLLSRMLSSILTLSENEITLTGEGTLLGRPFKPIIEGLKLLGCEASSINGSLPLKIKGPLKGGAIEIDGALTSQFLSGLLFSLPLAEQDSVVRVRNLVSRPYIDLTLSVLEKFGIKIQESEHEFRIPGKQRFIPTQFSIEGDWSGASFLLVGGALSGSVSISDLSISSHQGDKAIIEVLKLAGASVDINGSTVKIESRPLKAFRFDAANCPDLIPALITLGAGCAGESVIAGAGRLIFKESNRAASLLSEFTSIGAKIEWDRNLLRVSGGKIKGGKANSHGDHRIAMACAIAGLISDNGVSIDGAEAVTKSYPDFFNVLSTVTS